MDASNVTILRPPAPLFKVKSVLNKVIFLNRDRTKAISKLIQMLLRYSLIHLIQGRLLGGGLKVIEGYLRVI